MFFLDLSADERSKREAVLAAPAASAGKSTRAAGRLPSATNNSISQGGNKSGKSAIDKKTKSETQKQNKKNNKAKGKGQKGKTAKSTKGKSKKGKSKKGNSKQAASGQKQAGKKAGKGNIFCFFLPGRGMNPGPFSPLSFAILSEPSQLFDLV